MASDWTSADQQAAKAVELFDAVDSVDSVRMAEKLNASAESAGKKLSVLIEINVAAKRQRTASQQLRKNLTRFCAARRDGVILKFAA